MTANKPACRWLSLETVRGKHDFLTTPFASCHVVMTFNTIIREALRDIGAFLSAATNDGSSILLTALLVYISG